MEHVEKCSCIVYRGELVSANCWHKYYFSTQLFEYHSFIFTYLLNFSNSYEKHIVKYYYNLNVRNIDYLRYI